MRHLLVALPLIAVALGIAVTPASADEPAPLRVALVNVAASGGDSASETLQGFLENSDDIDAVSADDVWREAEKFDLDKVDFRSSAKREQNAREFHTIMRELDLEGLLIVDVFSRGRKLQVVVLGPTGTQLADVREDVRRGRLSKSGARQVLKGAFGELVPEVLAFRENGGHAAYVEEEEEEEEEEVEEEVDLVPPVSEAEDEEPDEEVAKKGEDEEDEEDEEDFFPSEPRETPRCALAMLCLTNSDSNLALNAGLLVGRRTYSMQTDSAEVLNFKSPFAGMTGRLDGILTAFDADAAIGFSVFAGYAPFTTVFDGSRPLASQYARLAGELAYEKKVSPELRARATGGLEAVSLTIEQNALYTGNRYLAGRIGGGVTYALGPTLLHAQATVLPVFGTNNSDGAFGASGLNFGLEPSLGVQMALSDEIMGSFSYTLQRFSPTYDGGALLGTPVDSHDTTHTAMLAIGYGL